jgi:hypothetical protein
VIGPTNAIGGGAFVLLAWAITLLLRPRLLGLERKAALSDSAVSDSLRGDALRVR